MESFSRQSRWLFDSAKDILAFEERSEYSRRTGGVGRAGDGPPPRFDFVTGNPYEMPLPEVVEALGRAIEPQHKGWLGYMMSEPGAREAIARSLHEGFGGDFLPEDIYLTNGGFGALALALRIVADPGDEVIITTPCFMFYEALIAAVGATPVRVPAQRPTFDLDLEGIRAAITPRTAAVIVNTPSNPSGRIYDAASLRELGAMLEERSESLGRRIWLLSDEAFNRIIYDERPFYSPTRYYPHSFLLYTYGKTLLAPGVRLGYIAVPRAMLETSRAHLRELVPMVQTLGGWLFPSATLQYAVADLEKARVDITHLQQNRDTLTRGLSAAGYEVNRPEGTFFMMAQSPWPDDGAFVELLAKHDVFVMPGSLLAAPGYFRVSLTVPGGVAKDALPAFAAALDDARSPR